MDEKIILIIGDSTSLPREEVSYYKTWPYLIKLSFSDYIIENISTWGNTTNGLLSRSNLEWYGPKIVIIQLGVVDCAPRLLNKYERKILSIFPGYVGKMYSSVNKRFRKRTSKKAYVPIERFGNNIEDYISRSEKQGVDHIIFVGILNSGIKYTTKNPNSQDAIKRYNKIIYECSQKSNICEFLELDLSPKEIDEITIEDGYHYNEKGNMLIHNEIESLIERIITKRKKEKYNA